MRKVRQGESSWFLRKLLFISKEDAEIFKKIILELVYDRERFFKNLSLFLK